MKTRGLFAILVALALQDGRPVWSGEAQGHRSLCKQYHRVNKTQMVSYEETFHQPIDYNDRYEDLYETVTRLNFRNEIVTTWLEVVTCCDGYEPRQGDELAKDCIPVCPSGCTFGECSRPNVCNCETGYEVYVNETTGYGDCRPHCESGCVGGVCVAPATCVCNSEYTLSSDRASCVPACYNGFGADACGANAICAAPNVCQCHQGYARAARNTSDSNVHTAKTVAISDWIMFPCLPVCEPKCGDNATCWAPNECRCKEGYRWATSVESTINNTCVPVCDQICFNGYCARPNECRCNEGYAAHAASGSHVCEPICSKGCVNGKCTMPNRCECIDGYAKLILRNGTLGVGLSDNVCSPICPGQCPNGRCAAPGLCHCDPGYVLATTDEEETVEGMATTVRANNSNASGHLSQTCRPFCQPSCDEGSVCVAPNRCQFSLPNQGYMHKRLSEQVRIVYSHYDCGPDGVFSDKNNADCTCSYHHGDNGETCNEPVLCAVIILGNSSVYDREFDGLKSLIFWNDTGGAAGASDNATGLPSSRVDLDWAGPKCSKECRISILAKNLKAISKNDVACHPLRLHDPIAGLVFTTLATLPPSNGSVVCFVKDRFECHDATSTLATSTMAIVVSVIIILNVVLVIALPIYLNRRKIWKNCYQERTGMNGTMLQRPVGGEDSPFQADDDSHL